MGVGVETKMNRPRFVFVCANYMEIGVKFLRILRINNIRAASF
jgi:hypothetical protein